MSSEFLKAELLTVLPMYLIYPFRFHVHENVIYERANWILIASLSHSNHKCCFSNKTMHKIFLNNSQRIAEDCDLALPLLFLTSISNGNHLPSSRSRARLPKMAIEQKYVTKINHLHSMRYLFGVKIHGYILE